MKTENEDKLMNLLQWFVIVMGVSLLAVCWIGLSYAVRMIAGATAGIVTLVAPIAIAVLGLAVTLVEKDNGEGINY